MTATELTRPTPNPTATTDSARVVPFDLFARPGPRERDFGVGYGKSSGYASNRRYVTETAGRTFRVA
ncbi:hypothetical protein [Cognatilysobacter lacus]|uniref:Uncharacterized protein n=1 Tax=Cognatilysobacter lacus TaxID=1643323 RepID=A0A5D8Z236_9GAMM|nr:hypothetical protein [Lysobacter lacus]TZF88143.1 hypothetical protein FW784_10270 [Lysobacter lacus]